MRIESSEFILHEDIYRYTLSERSRDRESNQTLEEILLCLFGLDSWGSSIIDKLKSRYSRSVASLMASHLFFCFVPS